MEKNKTIPVFSAHSETLEEQTNMFPGVKQTIGKISAVQVKVLEQNIQIVLSDLVDLFNNIELKNNKFDIDTISLVLNVSSGGKVSLVGEINSNLTSGITVTLKRQKS